MQFVDLKAQQELIRGEIETNIGKVLDHGRYIMGPEVFELEERLADYVGTKHCIAVASGTDALLIAMMALGVGEGDEVITTPFTFIATGEMIALLGAIPVFVDIDPKTYNIDPSRIEEAITPKTKAIMPVSLYGQCADFDAINAIAQRHSLPVIEDGAQSFGASYNGRKSCALSTIGCTSFFPSKPLGGYGDSGACFTDDEELAKVMREIRVHGQDRRYHHPTDRNQRPHGYTAGCHSASQTDPLPGRGIPSGKGRQQLHPAAGRAVSQRHSPHIAEGNSSVYAQYTCYWSSGMRFRSAYRRTAFQPPSTTRFPCTGNRLSTTTNSISG